MKETTDIFGRNALVEALTIAHVKISRRENSRCSQAERDTELQSRNDVLLRLNALWSILQLLTEETRGELGADPMLRREIEGIGAKLLADLRERAPADWWTIRAAFKGIFTIASATSTGLSGSRDGTCLDLDAREAMVRLCESLFGAAQAGGFYAEIPPAEPVGRALIAAIVQWQAHLPWRKD